MPLRLILLFFITLWAGADDKVRSWLFEADREGDLPAGWHAAHTYEGTGSVWKIVTDATAPAGSKVLAQTSSAGPNKFFNLCVAQDANYRDVDLSVSLKAVSGKQDQGGGLVWRYQDADNYYLARANPLEDNFRVYKVEKSVRTMFASADIKIPAGEWHRLRVEQNGTRIRCYLNGKQHLEVTDETFAGPGKVGLWTKADAVTYFDDLQAAGK
jgi:hypothetical protein